MIDYFRTKVVLVDYLWIKGVVIIVDWTKVIFIWSIYVD